MSDKENIIKGLEACSLGDTMPDCENCPMNGPGFGFACRDELRRKALHLLKEQEEILHTLQAECGAVQNDRRAARLLTLDEAVLADVCFVEYRGAGISPAFVSLVKYSWLNEPMYRIQYANSHFYPDIAKCGKHYRIWSTLPTKEQAEAEPWK